MCSSAYLNLLGHRAGRPAGGARGACAPPRAARPTEREALHVAAAGALADGRWHEAGRILEDLSIRYPQRPAGAAGGPPDRLLHRPLAHAARPHRARRVALARRHAGPPRGAVDAGLRPRGDRRLRARREDRPARRRARAARRLGLARGGARDGDAEPARATASPGWRRTPRRGARAASSPVHNWWHLALFHLGLDQVDEVLALLDQRVLGSASPLVLDMIDASALLWRLQLRGVPVGRPLGRAGRALARGRRGQHLRLQRPARDDGLRRRRPHGRRGAAARRAAAGAGSATTTTRSSCATSACGATQAIHALRARPPSPRPRELLRRVRPVAAALRRQPCPARPARPDADRGGRTRRRPPLADALRASGPSCANERGGHACRRPDATSACPTGDASRCVEQGRARRHGAAAAARHHRHLALVRAGAALAAARTGTWSR